MAPDLWVHDSMPPGGAKGQSLVQHLENRLSDILSCKLLGRIVAKSSLNFLTDLRVMK